MHQYLLRRTIQMVPQLLILFVLSFVLMHLTPGLTGVIDMESPEAQDLLAMQTMLGLDRPLHVQFLDWLWRMMHLDFGRSLIDNQPVIDKILDRLPATLLLTGTALLISVVISIPLGVLAAIHRNSWFDYLLTFVAFFGISIPAFWAAIVAIIVFGVLLGWLPVQGMRTIGQAVNSSMLDTLRHLILPAGVLGLEGTAALTRYTRSSMSAVLLEPYIRTARSKGLNTRKVLLRHALKNAVMPVVTILGLRLPILVGGAVLIETVFAWPGIGRLGWESVVRRDYPVVLALVVFTGVLTIIGNLLADVAYSMLDPRIRLEARS